MKKFTELLEDLYASDFKEKEFMGPDGKWHKRKLRPHRVDFKASKMRGEPAQKDSGQDVGMKEENQIDELDRSTLKSYINKNIKTGRADSDKGDSGLYRATKKVASTLSTSTLDKKVNRLGNTSSSDNKNKYEYDASRSELKNRGTHYFGGKKFKEDTDMTIDEQINEVLAKDATAGDWIHDFVHSDNPKFAGKSQEKRKQMALAAYYAKQRNEEFVNEESTAYEKSEENKRSADSAKKLGNMFDHHLHMSDYHDNLSQWHSEKGRHSLADNHAKKSEEHHEKAMALKENAPVAPTLDRKYIKGTPENKAHKEKNKPINGHPTNVKEKTMKTFKEMVDQITEKSEQAKKNKTIKNMMDASKGAQFNRASGLNMKPSDTGHETPQQMNKALGRSLRKEEVKVNDTLHPAGAALLKHIKPEHHNLYKPHLANDTFNGSFADRHAVLTAAKQAGHLNEAKDEQEYGYEGDMAMNQLETAIRHATYLKDMMKPDTDLPEWVQSKITLATDYLQTACDYMTSEMNEELKGGQKKLDKNKNGKLDAHDFKILRGEDEMHEETCPVCHKDPCECNDVKESRQMNLRSGVVKMHPNGVQSDTEEGWETPEPAGGKTKKEFKETAEKRTISFSDFINEIKMADLPRRTIKGSSYGAQYHDPEGDDEGTERKQVAKSEPAVKRGRGRPAGSKSGANQKVTSGTKRTGVDYTGYKLHLPNTNR